MSTAEPEPATTYAVKAIRCDDCPLGRVSGVGEGMFCPFVTREEPAGAVLTAAGAKIQRVWFVKSGVVGTSEGDHPPDAVDRVHLPGSFVGLECLTRERHVEGARVLAAAELCTATIDGFLDWLIQSGSRLAFIERAWRAWRAASPR